MGPEDAGLPEVPVNRDSLFQEAIIWEGRPALIRTPGFMVAVAGALAVTALVSCLFGVVLKLGLGVVSLSHLATALLTGTLAVAAYFGPRLWLEKVRYAVTASRVIVSVGPLRRTIARRSISFARLDWDPKHPGHGSLELVRAVQTGALRRRLTLTLNGLKAPDRVLAIIRGSEDATPAGLADRPLAQRLDVGERICWSGTPRPHFSAYLPHGPREWGQLVLAVVLAAALYGMLTRGVQATTRILDAGFPLSSPLVLALVAAQVTTGALLAAGISWLAREALRRGALLIRHTRYLITDRRVLIQRGREELHLERRHIVDVIDTPTGHAGLHDVFLVLDGPRARALAASGAFGEIDLGPRLRPVLLAVDDPDSVRGILLASPPSPPSRPGPLPHAA